VRALEALGRSPAQIGAAAVLGACSVGLAAALAIAALHSVDVRGFYPTAARATAWQWEGDAFVDHARGIRVDPEGAPERQPREPAAGLASIPSGGRAAAALASAAAGLALPMLLAEAMLARRPSRRRAPRRDRMGTPVLTVALAVTAVAASIILFQASAAHRAPALMGAVPPLALLAFAARRYRFAA
jgi:hypothetical protein